MALDRVGTWAWRRLGVGRVGAIQVVSQRQFQGRAHRTATRAVFARCRVGDRAVVR